MEAEHYEIAEFLGRYPPFDALPTARLEELAAKLEIGYYRAGDDIYRFGDEIHDFCMIRSGAVEIYRRNGKLYNRLSQGDVFGQLGLLMGNQVRLPARALEDALVYFIPEIEFTRLCDDFDEFAYFVEIDDQRKLNQVVKQQQQESPLSGARVGAILARSPVWIIAEASIRQAAKLMTQEGVSSLLVVSEQCPIGDIEDTQPKLVGILTDRDLRTRVVSEGVNIDAPVADVMTDTPITIDRDTYVFEAMLTMLRCNIHHLPVVHQGRPVGVVAISDMVRFESKSSLYIVSLIHRQQTVEELAQVAADVTPCFVRMVQDNASAAMIGSAMSIIGQSFIQRLLELGEDAFGLPPVEYCFLSLGSMARDEQLLITDQDNALVLADDFNPKVHDAYFAQLSQFVSDGLDQCGYPYCTGQIMATNPKWRKTRSQWQDSFAQWIDVPDPEALLNCSIFFDLEGVWGRNEWAEELSRFIVERAQSSPNFLASMGRNALLRTPPLGFFKGFVMEQDGEHRRTINLKRRGTAPLVDLIRVHGFAVGCHAKNSFERLDAIQAANILPEGRARELRDAMEYLTMVRIRHQAEDVEEGHAPDNTIEPDKLTDAERRNLKDAFQVLSNGQRFVKFKYPYQRR